MNWESNFENKPVRTLFKAFFYLMLILTVLSFIACPFVILHRTVASVGQVVSEEFAPKEMLRKYEWFKDAAAQLDKKSADLKVYSVRLSALGDSYQGAKRSDWAREDREQWNLIYAESTGIKNSYNMLAAEYNAQMTKFNYRFANVGTLPAGASTPLPREYKPYIEE